MSERTGILAEEQAVEAWHFLPDDRRLRWGSREVIKPGSIVTVDPPLELCRVGLHASVRAIDALEYAPGPIICRVQLWGDVIHDGDKLCGQHRRVLWMADATKTLHRFACDVATEALDLIESKGEKIDPRCRKAIEIKLAWLRGEATDEELDAAWAAAGSAAWAAAGSAAWDAAGSAAGSAAGAAAWAAAWAAARAAAWAAARDAAWAAAGSAAWAAARDAAWAAARDAAWAAARDAAWDAQNRRLHDLFIAFRESVKPKRRKVKS